MLLLKKFPSSLSFPSSPLLLLRSLMAKGEDGGENSDGIQPDEEGDAEIEGRRAFGEGEALTLVMLFDTEYGAGLGRLLVFTEVGETAVPLDHCCCAAGRALPNREGEEGLDLLRDNPAEGERETRSLPREGDSPP